MLFILFLSPKLVRFFLPHYFYRFDRHPSVSALDTLEPTSIGHHDAANNWQASSYDNEKTGKSQSIVPETRNTQISKIIGAPAPI